MLVFIGINNTIAILIQNRFYWFTIKANIFRLINYARWAWITARTFLALRARKLALGPGYRDLALRAYKDKKFLMLISRRLGNYNKAMK